MHLARSCSCLAWLRPLPALRRRPAPAHASPAPPCARRALLAPGAAPSAAPHPDAPLAAAGRAAGVRARARSTAGCPARSGRRRSPARREAQPRRAADAAECEEMRNLPEAAAAFLVTFYAASLVGWLNSMNNRVLPTLIVGLGGRRYRQLPYDALCEQSFRRRDRPGQHAARSRRGSAQRRQRSRPHRQRGQAHEIVGGRDHREVNGQQVIPADPFFQQFFGGQGPGIVQPYHGEASGSGFVIDSSGDIVTNAHVLQPPQRRQGDEADGRLR